MELSRSFTAYICIVNSNACVGAKVVYGMVIPIINYLVSCRIKREWPGWCGRKLHNPAGLNFVKAGQKLSMTIFEGQQSKLVCLTYKRGGWAKLSPDSGTRYVMRGPRWPSWSTFNDCSALVSAFCCLHVIWAVKDLTGHGAKMVLCFDPLCSEVACDTHIGWHVWHFVRVLLG